MASTITVQRTVTTIVECKGKFSIRFEVTQGQETTWWQISGSAKSRGRQLLSRFEERLIRTIEDSGGTPEGRGQSDDWIYFSTGLPWNDALSDLPAYAASLC